MPQVPKHMQDSAIDLAAVRDNADRRDAEAAQKAANDERERNIKTVASWQRAMNRAFKGILPRPERTRMLAVALREADADA